MDPESSLELIRRAQTGDAAALDRLLERYRPRLQRWARGRLPRQVREMMDTEDLVQEALIGTVRNFHAFEQRGEWALQAYLRRAVTNRIRDELRRFEVRPKRQEFPDDVQANEKSPLETALGAEAFAQYETALAALDDVEREAVLARLELGCSYQEIAELVDRTSPDAARMLVVRALRKLAELMSSPSESAASEQAPQRGASLK
jgi:RNA polymerase sigma-70 factor, ECF subfamily